MSQFAEANKGHKGGKGLPSFRGKTLMRFNCRRDAGSTLGAMSLPENEKSELVAQFAL
jgi:hypothetical protein